MRLNLLLALVGAVCARPNIVVLLTDDQDLRLGSPDYQQVLQERLVKKGASFMNHHVTTAVCCPSRASLLKGQLAHNTNITHVRAPGSVRCFLDQFVADGSGATTTNGSWPAKTTSTCLTI
jgi:arylsulfatase A-like enzyme